MRWVVLMAVGLSTAAVVGCRNPDETDAALCDHVEAVAEVFDDAAVTLGDEPEPGAVADLYRALSQRYAAVASALDDEAAAERTADTAALHEEAATVLDGASGLPPAEVSELVETSPVLQALRERRRQDAPLGLPRGAWDQIDRDCDIEVDPPAEPSA